MPVSFLSEAEVEVGLMLSLLMLLAKNCFVISLVASFKFSWTTFFTNSLISLRTSMLRFRSPFLFCSESGCADSASGASGLELIVLARVELRWLRRELDLGIVRYQFFFFARLRTYQLDAQERRGPSRNAFGFW